MSTAPCAGLSLTVSLWDSVQRFTMLSSDSLFILPEHAVRNPVPHRIRLQHNSSGSLGDREKYGRERIEAAVCVHACRITVVESEREVKRSPEMNAN